jgi:quercetin dioxygenase-like cupin family protein
METRRTFIGMAAASLVPLGLDAQTSSQAVATPRGELARHALTGPFEGYEVVVTEVTAQALPPDAPGRPHRHSGFVLGYVIDGQLSFAINNEAPRIVPAGGTFFEPIGALHSTNRAVGGAPARFLAFLVVPKGAPIVVGA